MTAPMTSSKFNTLQVLLACDARVRRIINRPALDPVLDETIPRVRRVLTIGAIGPGQRSVRRTYEYEYDVDKDVWTPSTRVEFNVGSGIQHGMHTVQLKPRDDDTVGMVVTWFRNIGGPLAQVRENTNVFMECDLRKPFTQHMYVGNTRLIENLEYAKKPVFVATTDGGAVMINMVHNASRMDQYSMYHFNGHNWSRDNTVLQYDIPWSAYAVVFNDKDDCLIAGGYYGDFDATATCWLVNMRTKEFKEAANMPLARYNHAGCLLSDGRIFVCGGLGRQIGYSTAISRCDIYNPETDDWQSAGYMSVPRAGHSCLLLDDGDILIVGGSTNPTETKCEIYNPYTKTSRPAASIPELVRGFTLVVLPERNE